MLIRMTPRQKPHHNISVASTSCRANFLIGVCSSSRNRRISDPTGYFMVGAVCGSAGRRTFLQVYREHTDCIVIFLTSCQLFVTISVFLYVLRRIRSATRCWIRRNILKITRISANDKKSDFFLYLPEIGLTIVCFPLRPHLQGFICR